MFNEMKLGTKIAAGYAGVLLITSLVTAFTLYQVHHNAISGDYLSSQVVPQAVTANEVERNVLASRRLFTMYELTRDRRYYDQGLETLGKVDSVIARGQAHVKQYPGLVSFGASIEKARGFSGEYREASEGTKEATERLLAAQERMSATAAAYAEAAESFRRAQPASAEIHAATAVLMQARAETWKAYALMKPQMMDEAPRLVATLGPIFDRMSAGARTAEQERLVETLRTSSREYGAQVKALQNAWYASDAVSDKRRAAAIGLADAAKDVSEGALESTVKQSGDISTQLGSLRAVVFFGLLVAAVLSVIMALTITRSITGPINRIISGLSAAGEQVASASSQVSSSSQQLANGASQQASNLEEVSSSLEEVTSMTRQNAENARKANSSAQESADAANRGAASMNKMNDAMQKIGSSATETAKIVKTIDEIAFQTNLLALNAAVEAARAGEAGKGFAVVAEEVRNLAQRSAEAAKNTAALIEEASRNAASGNAISEQVGGVLKEIVGGAQRVTSLVAEVATASEQQTSGVGQINTSVSQMDRITQSNAANAEESASASEELSAQAIELNEMVEQLSRLVNGAGAGSHVQAEVKKPAKRAVSHAPSAGAPAQARKPAGASAVRPPPRAAAPAAGFEALPSHPVDPKDLIPLDDSELKQF
ncbi:MAG: methyl-accepting chemotaxis protein [Archangium sp.]|nr:methyl-accepting chemotaxis protein [Archangium sp.]MDP3571333.1 methyl-accepting chemotaxis protein [Archangium sp.]